METTEVKKINPITEIEGQIIAFELKKADMEDVLNQNLFIEVTNKATNVIAKKALGNLRTARVNVDKDVKSLRSMIHNFMVRKKDAVTELGKELTRKVTSAEKKQAESIKKFEKSEEIRKAEETRIEAERISKHREKITQFTSRWSGSNMIKLSFAQIDPMLKQFEENKVKMLGADFEEFEEEVIDAVTDSESMLIGRVNELKAQESARLENEKLRKQNEEMQRLAEAAKKEEEAKAKAEQQKVKPAQEPQAPPEPPTRTTPKVIKVGGEFNPTPVITKAKQNDSKDTETITRLITAMKINDPKEGMLTTSEGAQKWAKFQNDFRNFKDEWKIENL